MIRQQWVVKTIGQKNKSKAQMWWEMLEVGGSKVRHELDPEKVTGWIHEEGLEVEGSDMKRIEESLLSRSRPPWRQGQKGNFPTKK